MTSASELLGVLSVSSSSALTSDSRAFSYNTACGLGATSSTTSTADLRGGSSVRSAGSNLGIGGYP